MKGGNGLDEPFARKSRRSTSAFLPYRAVGIGEGGREGSNDPSDFGRSVFPYLNQGADNDHQITTKGQAISRAILPKNKRNALRI